LALRSALLSVRAGSQFDEARDAEGVGLAVPGSDRRTEMSFQQTSRPTLATTCLTRCCSAARRSRRRPPRSSHGSACSTVSASSTEHLARRTCMLSVVKVGSAGTCSRGSTRCWFCRNSAPQEGSSRRGRRLLDRRKMLAADIPFRGIAASPERLRWARSGSRAEGRFQGASRRTRASTSRRACRVARAGAACGAPRLRRPRSGSFGGQRKPYAGLASASSEPSPARGGLLYA